MVGIKPNRARFSHSAAVATAGKLPQEGSQSSFRSFGR